MQFFTIIAIVFCLFLCIFVLQNSAPVDIKFLFWQFHDISLALVIFSSVALGALIVFLIGLSSQFKRTLRMRELEGKNKRMVQEVKKLKDTTYSNENSIESNKN